MSAITAIGFDADDTLWQNETFFRMTEQQLATLGLRTYLGRAYQYQSDTAAGMLIANGPLSKPLEPGSAAKLVPVPDQCTILAVE